MVPGEDKMRGIGADASEWHRALRSKEPGILCRLLHHSVAREMALRRAAPPARHALPDLRSGYHLSAPELPGPAHEGGTEWAWSGTVEELGEG